MDDLTASVRRLHAVHGSAADAAGPAAAAAELMCMIAETARCALAPLALILVMDCRSTAVIKA